MAPQELPLPGARTTKERFMATAESSILNVADGDERDLVAGGPGRDHCVADSYGEIGVGCEGVRIR